VVVVDTALSALKPITKSRVQIVDERLFARIHAAPDTFTAEVFAASRII
jgi:hypothetical protein